MVLPHSMFKERLYKKEIRTASDALSEMAFNSAGFKLSPFLEMVTPIPAPTEILEKICYRFLKENTAVILYLTDSEDYGQVRYCVNDKNTSETRFSMIKIQAKPAF